MTSLNPARAQIVCFTEPELKTLSVSQNIQFLLSCEVCVVTSMFTCLHVCFWVCVACEMET